MARGGNKINASMDSRVDELPAIDSVLLLQKGLKPRFNVVKNGFPALLVVDEIAKAGGIHDG